MERLLEFKNIIINYENASAELFLDGKYIMTFISPLENIVQNNETPITLYRYFCTAINTYSRLNGMPILNKQ